MELAIKGSDQKLSVSDSVFGRDFSQDLVHQVVVAFRNAGRSGTKAQLRSQLQIVFEATRQTAAAAVGTVVAPG